MISKLTDADVDRLVEIDAEVNPAPWSKVMFAEEFGQGNRILLGERLEGVLAGYITSRVVGDIAEVLNLAVARSYQRQGVGGRLLRSLCDEVIKCGAKQVELEVRSGNIAAIKLYAMHNFCEVGRRKDFYPDGEDAILFTCKL